MKTTLLLLLLLFPYLSLAQVDFTTSKEILMEAKTCTELNKHAESIAAWTRASNNTNPALPECFCSSTKCRMDVAPISPYFVKELTNFENGFAVSSAYNGPNCFNAALVSSQTLPKINFTHPLEMTAILGSPLCKEKKISEALTPGDILVVRDPNNIWLEIHAGIYINDELAFSKYGEISMMPYSYGLNVDKAYGVHDPNCKRVLGRPAPGENCYNKVYVNYFTCDALYTFISKLVNQPAGIHSQVQKIYAATSRYDSLISNVAMKGDKVTATDVSEFQQALKELYAQTEPLVADATLTKDNTALARLMRFRIFSLFEQTRRIAVGLGDKKLASHVLEEPQL
ncbi:MAG: hypothetical protein IT287_04880 [Bdellovibrionaceae bacterium]|nr:hypothetical protein [Pseudobdellovibrionaceae bacterium]